MNTADELFALRLSEKRTSYMSLLRIHRLMSFSKASGSTLRSITTIIPKDLIADTLEISPQNLSKLYQRKSLSRTQTEQLEGLTYLWGKIQQELFIDDQQMMQRWLDTPVPALDGEKPKSLMGTITGRKLVEQYLQKLSYGDYC